jgi:hypothetical protein
MFYDAFGISTTFRKIYYNLSCYKSAALILEGYRNLWDDLGRSRKL